MDTKINTNICTWIHKSTRDLYMDTEINTGICTWIQKSIQVFVHGYRNQ